MSEKTIRVLLIEDHDIFRQGVRMILDAQPDITVVGETRTGEQGLTHLTESGDVDVIITDLVLPGISGIDIVRRVKAINDHVRIILLTLHADDEHIRGMIRAGADGYVMKQVAVEELIGAIHTVVRGETALTPLVARRLMNQIQSDREQERRVDALSERELQILTLLAQGLTSKEIARQVSISANTVDNHRARLLSKLGVNNTASAISLALRQGLLPPID